MQSTITCTAELARTCSAAACHKLALATTLRFQIASLTSKSLKDSRWELAHNASQALLDGTNTSGMEAPYDICIDVNTHH
jgi:hypothetical protein